MIVCERCAKANGLPGTPVRGSAECSVCPTATLNGCVDVGDLTELQIARAKKAHKTFSFESLKLLEEALKRDRGVDR